VNLWSCLAGDRAVIHFFSRRSTCIDIRSRVFSVVQQTSAESLTMSGLFGAASSSASSSANTLGDLSTSIALNSPPEDSVSDISFSTRSDHLAVASWDKKVRIYEINASGGSEGKALFEHEAPVLSCHWSPVSHPLRKDRKMKATMLTTYE
jgi:WD40 repeat protein